MPARRWPAVVSRLATSCVDLAAEVLGLADAFDSLRLIQARVVCPLDSSWRPCLRSRLWRPTQWAVHVSATFAGRRMAERVMSGRYAKRSR